MAATSWYHYRRSLASRVILLTAIAVGLSVAAVAAVAYVTVRQQSIRSLDDSLHQRATVAAQYDLITMSEDTLPAIVLSASDVRLFTINLNNGRLGIAGRGHSALTPGRTEVEVARGQHAWSARTVSADGIRYRMVAVPTQAPGTALVLAQSLESTDRMLSRLGLISFLVGLAGVILAGLAGWLVARNGLRPVRRLTFAAEEIARTENLDPIPVEGNDDIARLANAFNAMLGSLSASRDRQRQLVADAGHELRTPLTSLRTNIELLSQAAASDRLSVEARQELLDDVQAQIAEMTTLIGDLVELARDEPPPSEPQTVDLSEVVEAAVARVRRRASGLDFTVDLDPWFVEGDATALERASTNLLDNAAKWSPPGGTVRVRLADGTLTVIDEGEGIPEADLPHVFDRFYRSREARSMPGSGLGLSIVSAVAERHGGTVRAGRADTGGAELTLTLPGSPSAPGATVSEPTPAERAPV